MTRRAVLALPLGCAACAKREPSIEVFPQSIAGWTRASLRELTPSEAPDPVAPANLRRIQIATYEGAGKIEVRAYELTRQEIGLDLAQRWKPSPDTVFFWARSWFVVVKWQEADRKALQEFTRSLEKRLNAN